ncbi:MAG: translation initiation factor IF-3 [Acidobacteriota bacterium]
MKIIDRRIRINERIRVREIRVIGDKGEQLGIMSPAKALSTAREAGLDLVEVSPTSVPPVCRIMDFGKYQYERNKQAQAARKKQRHFHVKEVKFRPGIDEHDYDFKKRNILRFLEHGDKVKALVIFRGRENAHPEIGRKLLEKLIGEIREHGQVETVPLREGNTMVAILAPLPRRLQEKIPAGRSGQANPSARKEA